jgi:anti-sigma factor RsiW
MICLSKNKDGPDILMEHLGGTLDAARSAELERHAQDCADCRKLLSVWNTLDVWEAPAVSADFDARLFARMAREEEVKPWWRRMLWRPALPLAVAGALLAVMLMVHLPSTPVPVKPAAVDPEIVQVEQTLADLDLLTPLRATPADRN